MSDVEFIKSQAFNLGESSYSISIYHSADGYMAFCDCHTCENHNMQTQQQADPEAAIKECEELIRSHHDDCHGSTSCSA